MDNEIDNKIDREKIKKIASEKGITYQKACIIHFEIDGFFKTRKANNILAEIGLKVPTKQKTERSLTIKAFRLVTSAPERMQRGTVHGRRKRGSYVNTKLKKTKSVPQCD